MALHADHERSVSKPNAATGCNINRKPDGNKDRAYHPMIEQQADIRRTFAEGWFGLQSPPDETKLGLR